MTTTAISLCHTGIQSTTEWVEEQKPTATSPKTNTQTKQMAMGQKNKYYVPACVRPEYFRKNKLFCYNFWIRFACTEFTFVARRINLRPPSNSNNTLDRISCSHFESIVVMREWCTIDWHPSCSCVQLYKIHKVNYIHYITLAMEMHLFEHCFFFWAAYETRDTILMSYFCVS